MDSEQWQYLKIETSFSDSDSKHVDWGEDKEEYLSPEGPGSSSLFSSSSFFIS